MPRVSADDVKLICNTALDDDSIEASIADASAWIDANLEGQCDGQTEGSLAAVEKYLTAHFLQRREPVVKSEKAGPVAVTYATPEGATEYLDMAASFDPCGIVSGAFAKAGKSVQFAVGPGYADDV